ncbi:MAG: 4Fe-4S binding protein [Chloroflexi bacterium]|nr:4Fe-4S binding protein [Chloroflexota bacterium]
MKASGGEHRARCCVAIPEIDTSKCISCGNCVEECPVGIVTLVDGKAVITNPEACSYCTECESFCPSAAIRCPIEIVLGAPES